MKARVVALVALSLAGCNSGGDKLTKLPAAETAAAEAATPVNVTTVRAARTVVSRDVVASGTTEPAREANIGPQMTARVASVLVREGDLVKSGAQLVRLDSLEASLRVQQVAANAASTASQYELARAEYERMAPLAQKGTVTAQQIERLERQRDTLKASVDATRVAAADAERNVGNTTVRAPFAGVISKVLVEIGEVVTMMPVTHLVRLVDISNVDVRVHVHERELARIQLGNAVKAKFAATGQLAVGKVTFISPEIDARTRTAEVVTRIPNADAQLRAGMFAEISIAPSRSQESVVLPTSAVAGAGENRYVFAVKNGLVERRKVKVSPVTSSLLEVLEGLAEGDEVVHDGLGRLSDGAHVTVTKSAESTTASVAPEVAAPGNGAPKAGEADGSSRAQNGEAVPAAKAKAAVAKPKVAAPATPKAVVKPAAKTPAGTPANVAKPAASEPAAAPAEGAAR